MLGAGRCSPAFLRTEHLATRRRRPSCDIVGRMAKMLGAKRHLQRLSRLLSSQTRRDVVAALYEAGQRIELDAEKSITQGSVSGKNHVPSAPGQPPNADTRFLDTNIETRIDGYFPPQVSVVSSAPYSAALEFGTSKMEERPFMRPALARNRKRLAEGVAGAVRKAAQ